MITIRTISEAIVNMQGFNKSLNKQQVKEVLRSLGNLIRPLTDDQKEEVMKAIIAGNKRLSDKVT